MVAISLYKGNLHKPPNVPCRWQPPTPKISLNDFRILLRRRNRALARLCYAAADADINVSATSSPSPSPGPTHANADSIPMDHAVNNTDGDNLANIHGSEPELLPKVNLKECVREIEEEVREMMTDEKEDSSRKLMETDAMVEDLKNEEIVKNDVRLEAIAKPNGEKSNSADATIDVERQTKEVKEKLEILNEKKHKLVQLLKQILNAEEQLKRQSSTPEISVRPQILVDTATDSGSMTKANTPRVGPDGIPCGDVERGEPDGVPNHNMTPRHLPRTSSASPSSDSQQRKTSSTMAPHSYRATMVTAAAASPSRFAPLAGQGQVHSSLSASSTSYVVSSPSPAASGGTSIFRDARLPSPWS